MSTFVPPVADPATTLPQQFRIYRTYRALVASSTLHGDAGLGGKLLFAGGMHSLGRDLLFAANVAGAASLAASADPDQQRMAIREGVVDFVVNSLAEALRILKNEVRKGQAVSVAVAADPRIIVAEMLERGVQPDLLPPRGWEDSESALAPGDWQRFLDQGSLAVAAQSPEDFPFIGWTVSGQHARFLPRLDLCAQSVLPSEELERQRWLRLAPRFLGRLAQRVHGVSMSSLELARFRDMAAALVKEQAAKDGDKEPVVVTIQPFLPEK